MTYNNIKNIILTVLFGFMALTSCIDEDFSLSGDKDYDIPEGIKEGYSINLVVTLDKMGGTRAASSYNPLELEEIENYIDPEKFRVLFFTTNEEKNEDIFLFESKSRWVKKLVPGSIHSEWLVSIPVFTYGNDIFDYDIEYVNEEGKTVTRKAEGKEKEWDWETIREALTTKPFKIAILANRPELDYYPKLSGIDIGAHWYDNKGPYWYPKDTGKKDVFDLHHCQYDPMYHGKSAIDLNSEELGKIGKSETEIGIGFYDFIMDDWDKNVTSKLEDAYKNMKPKMGATASWVNHKDRRRLPAGSPEGLTKDNSDYAYAILPSYEYPIPMYGIQKFDPIKNWTKGTPFNVSNMIQGSDGDASEYNFNTISLLRSVVRLDLLIPKASYERPNLVGLFYPNIYSRCEPMDVWTPTDDIWEDDHENDCEWNDIMDYGLIVSANEKQGGTNAQGSTIRNADDKFNFQNTISWFYGAWREKGWHFRNSEDKDLTPIDAEAIGLSYPKIFNPCVQRNKFVISSMCSTPRTEENPDPKPDPGIYGDVSDLYNDDYWHFVTYTGERNMLDANRIPLQGHQNQTSYAVTWMFKDVKKDQYFCIPIADYSKPQQYATDCFGPYVNADWNNSSNLPGKNSGVSSTQIKDYANTLRDNVPARGQQFTDEKHKGEEPRDEMPWPLLRNHIYRITVTGPGPEKLTKPYTWDFTKYPDAKTVFNLNTDTKWTNPNDLNTSGYVVSWNVEPTLSANSSTVDNVANVATWSDGYSITKNLKEAPSTAVISAISSGSNVSVDNASYKTIKTSADVENILKLPDGKTTKKIRLYSYINVDYNFSAKTKSGEKLSIKEGETKRIQNEATIAGGKLYATNATTGKTDDWEAVGGSGFYLWANDAFFKVELEYPLAVGDVISATVSEDSRGFYITSEDRKHPGVGNSTWPYIIKSSNSYTITENDPLVGQDIIYLYRYTASSTHFNDFKVTRKNRPVDNQSYWSEVNGKEYGAGDTGIDNYLSGYTMHEFTFEEAVNEVKFTNTGKQLCYVIWVEVGNPVEYWQLSRPNGEIKANGKYVPNLQGLKFVSDGSISIYDTDPSKIRLSTNNATITFPNIKPGLIVSITGQSPNATATNRGIEPANNSNLRFISGPQSSSGQCIFYGANAVPPEHENQVEGTNIYTFKWEVIDNSGDSETVPVSFNIINGGIDFYEFSIEDPNGISNAPSRASKNSEPSIMIKSEDLHSKSLKFSRR